MKKLVCLFLSLMLCVGALGAMAEAAVDYSKDEISVTITEPRTDLGKVELEESARALKSTDDVAKNKDVYSITTEKGLKLQLNAAGLSYLVLTQNYYASMDVYLRMKDEDAQDLLDNLITGDIHLLIWDIYNAFNCIYVRDIKGDGLSQHVRDLSTLTSNEISAVADAVALSEGVTNYDLATFNGIPWIQLAPDVLCTIKNSQYVAVYYVPLSDQMTEDDYADFTQFMNALTLD